MLLRKLFGILFVLAAAAGVVFSVAGLIEIWRYRPGVTQTVNDNLALLDQTLNIASKLAPAAMGHSL